MCGTGPRQGGPVTGCVLRSPKRPPPHQACPFFSATARELLPPGPAAPAVASLGFVSSTIRLKTWRRKRKIPLTRAPCGGQTTVSAWPGVTSGSRSTGVTTGEEVGPAPPAPCNLRRPLWAGGGPVPRRTMRTGDQRAQHWARRVATRSREVATAQGARPALGLCHPGPVVVFFLPAPPSEPRVPPARWGLTASGERRHVHRMEPAGVSFLQPRVSGCGGRQAGGGQVARRGRRAGEQDRG